MDRNKQNQKSGVFGRDVIDKIIKACKKAEDNIVKIDDENGKTYYLRIPESPELFLTWSSLRKSASSADKWMGWLAWVSGLIAVAGVVCNNAKVIWCFPLWLVSNSISAYLHIKARMWGLVARDVVFIGLAAVGWVMWAESI